jgi:phosphomannomutase
MDEDVAYRLGRAAAELYEAKSVVIGWDARATSAGLAGAVARGVTEAGADAWTIGLAGTEEMYCATAELGGCLGIEVTASHNPIDYNGMKLVAAGARPLDPGTDFQTLRRRAEAAAWRRADRLGEVLDKSAEARRRYVEKVLSFIDIKTLTPLNILINSGNGAAGPTFDAIADALAARGAPLTFARHHHEPDPSFPNGIPNPLLPENHAATAEAVRAAGADFGVAFDGDFDRCFLFDERGDFVPGEYLVGLLAETFLARAPGAAIVHDPRVIWSTEAAIAASGGEAVRAKTGHAYIKAAMREHDALYGGEMSAHHYFRDFHCCDSGMIPWLLIAGRLSATGQKLSELIAERRAAHPSSGERNFTVENAERAIAAVIDTFEAGATLDETDGVSLEFADWRFNLRKSNTEPLVRLNVEARGGAVDIEARVAEIAGVLLGEAGRR